MTEDRLRVETRPFPDQKPGTSGLRKKVRVFQADHYLENFVQSIFDALPADGRRKLVVGGDGRFFNREATQVIVRMAAANGVRHLVVGRDALLSTPALSNLVRRRGADGGIVLSASHNPGGPDADFGIKFNNASGSPAPESLTGRIFQLSRELRRFYTLDAPDIDLSRVGERYLGETLVEVVDSVADYQATMETAFDFDRLRSAFAAASLSVCFDGMHAVTGPYARRILEEVLGAAPGSVINAVPLEDFGGGHPDPNLVHARQLLERMTEPGAPLLGAASDGDGDRNLILGRGMFVSPSDSLAILAANATAIPQFSGGLAGVARSMPTSAAVDRVAAELGIDCFETPTGWKYFGNLLDAWRINLCGEESFGTGGDHVREKDGLWTVLAWMSLLAESGQSVEDLVRTHWARFGRNVYCRHDYEGIDTDAAESLMVALRESLGGLAGSRVDALRIRAADEFAYLDPVDGSRAAGQGIRIYLDGGARIVYRLSGTGTSGATLRVYLEHYREHDLGVDALVANQDLGRAAALIARIGHFAGLDAPTLRT